MGVGAIGAGLPAELPVIGALVESELANLHSGSADAVGYFQIRTSIWDRGAYAGYPDDPELQLRWYLDQAIAVNQRRTASGDEPYGDDSSDWGEWAADVLRPLDEYRDRYQARLPDARELLAAGCGGPATIAPRLQAAGKRVQDPVRRGAIVVNASCPAEACVASARGSISLPRRAKAHRLASRTRRIESG